MACMVWQEDLAPQRDPFVAVQLPPETDLRLVHCQLHHKSFCSKTCMIPLSVQNGLADPHKGTRCV